jgi:hypothetical protein
MIRGLTFKELGSYLFIADLKNNNFCDHTTRLFNSKRDVIPILSFIHIKNLCERLCRRSILKIFVKINIPCTLKSEYD